ncbi:MAG TPA: phytoene/squalene synthase family protein [Bryobacteraceae bacterium]|nr:phytoene/squalene synthase family protein [Bryobacteraceae bacterium]
MSTAVAAVLNPVSVGESYRHCRNIARKRAKNFYYSFLLLEKPQRDAMCAIYAFMRQCDDLSDDPVSTDKVPLQQSIGLWRLQLNRALHGDVQDDPIWPAFHDTVQRYGIPHRFFHEMIDGITSDIEPQRMKTYSDLYRYCYHVASVVGLTIIHIFGFESIRALLLAEKCGVAFQLTNILRDVREDALGGRVYLPQEDLERFGISVEQLSFGIEDDHFRELMRFETARAREYYAESESLLRLIDPKSRRSLWALREIYMRLLGKIEAANYNVLQRRIAVSTPAKMALLLSAFFHKSG